MRHAVAFSSKVFEFVRTLNTFEVAGELRLDELEL